MKLWLVRLVALVLISIGAAGVTFMITVNFFENGPPAKHWREKMKRELLFAGGLTAEWLENHPDEPSELLIAHVVGEGTTLRLFDNRLNELTGAPDKHNLTMAAQKCLQSGTFFITPKTLPPPPNDTPLTMAAKFTTIDGKERIAAMTIEPAVAVSPPSVLWRYGTKVGSVCVGLAVLSLLIWYTERPAREVRKALKSISDGKMDVRLDDNVAGGKDEIAKLAREFNEMADSLSRLHDEQRRMFGEISHEMRTPLSRMALAVELAGSDENGINNPMLERIRLDADRLNTLTNQMLDLSKIQRHQPTRTPVNISALVETICEECCFEAATNNRTVCAEKVPSSFYVSGCAESLRRMIENVIRNSLKHTPENSEVTISLEERLHTGRPNVVITIADNGSGVCAQDIPHLFSPFFRAKNTSAEGTGLGLSITRHVAISHGGNVWAENRQGGGLEVSIRIPLIPTPKTMDVWAETKNTENFAFPRLVKADSKAG